MRTHRLLRVLLSISAAALVAATIFSASHAQQARAAVEIDSDDIGGVVTGPNGPEAGVWVIAETRDLPVPLHQERRHRRPGPLRRARPAEGELHGLGARLRPGRQRQDDDARRAGSSTSPPSGPPTPAEAAQYYPAIYWYSMLKIPAAAEFGGQGQIPANVISSAGLIR